MNRPALLIAIAVLLILLGVITPLLLDAAEETPPHCVNPELVAQKTDGRWECVSHKVTP
jgi:hypothetical protein